LFSALLSRGDETDWLLEWVRYPVLKLYLLEQP